jgi:hypothetical protein
MPILSPRNVKHNECEMRITIKTSIKILISFNQHQLPGVSLDLYKGILLPKLK